MYCQTLGLGEPGLLIKPVSGWELGIAKLFLLMGFSFKNPLIRTARERVAFPIDVSGCQHASGIHGYLLYPFSI